MKIRNVSETEFISKVFPRALNNVSGFDVRFAPAVIKPNTMLREDLNLDSCDTMQLIISLETKYDINMKNVFAHKMINVGDVYKHFKKEISHKRRVEKMHSGACVRSAQIRWMEKYNQSVSADAKQR